MSRTHAEKLFEALEEWVNDVVEEKAKEAIEKTLDDVVNDKAEEAVDSALVNYDMDQAIGEALNNFDMTDEIREELDRYLRRSPKAGEGVIRNLTDLVSEMDSETVEELVTSLLQSSSGERALRKVLAQLLKLDSNTPLEILKDKLEEEGKLPAPHGGVQPRPLKQLLATLTIEEMNILAQHYQNQPK